MKIVRNNFCVENSNRNVLSHEKFIEMTDDFNGFSFARSMQIEMASCVESMNACVCPKIKYNASINYKFILFIKTIAAYINLIPEDK